MFPPFSHRIGYVLALAGIIALFTACSTSITIGSQTPLPSPVTTFVVTPTPTAIAMATLMPDATATPTKLFLYITCGDTRGSGYGIDIEHGKICAYTLPGATLQVQVSYCNGKLDPGAALQGPVLANEHGYYQWNWTPQPDCKGQPIWSYKATVTASLNGHTETQSISGMA